MQMRRGFLIGTLLILFLSCYHIMNQHYDELARYQYVNDDNRKLILEYLNTEDINYLIERQFQPNEFLSYLGIEGFNIRFLDWYNKALSNEDLGAEETVSIVNQLKEKMTYAQFRLYLDHYSISQLSDFFLEEHDFIHDLKLVNDPTSITGKISDTETLYTYQPENLVTVENVPMLNSTSGTETFQLENDTYDHLIMLCRAAFEVNEKTCGNMVMTQGYVSFEQQEIIYEKALLEYGADDVGKNADYPGQSLFQLGNVLTMTPANVDAPKTENEKSVQQSWLETHAQEFGFRFVNASEKKLDKFILQFDRSLLSENNKGPEGEKIHD